MNKKSRTWRLAALTILSLSALLTLHIFAMKYFWYIRFPVIDIPMHFLGGMSLAMSSLYILKRPKYILLASLLLGLAWEWFEVAYNLTGWPFGTTKYYMDTSLDIVMDMAGALTVWIISKYLRKNERISDIS